MSVTDCPECYGETKLVDCRNRWDTEIRHVRVCTDCSVEYVVSYGNPVIDEVDHV